MSALGAGRRDRSRGIVVRRLTKTLRGRQILRGVDLEVAPGSLQVIEGGNGAGKTTLMRVLATVLSPDAGEVLVNGYDVRRAGALVRRSIGLVLVNERSLYWRVDAVENLRVFGRLVGLSKRAVERRTASLLAELELEHVARERVGRLSTGQRQRVMIARALLTNAPVLLFDEPLRGLDDAGVRTVLDLLSSRARAGASVLVTAPLVAELVPIASAHARLVGGTLASARPAVYPVAVPAP